MQRASGNQSYFPPSIPLGFSWNFFTAFRFLSAFGFIRYFAIHRYNSLPLSAFRNILIFINDASSMKDLGDCGPNIVKHWILYLIILYK